MALVGERTLAFTKHEGAGNDFLVVLAVRDPGGDRAAEVLDPRVVRALCDRHTGVGADGLIVVGPGREGADLSMELRNADGGAAEMSGNGIRCLAQAAVDGGLVTPPTFTVATTAGVRTIEYRAGGPTHDGATPQPTAWASVDMGVVELGDPVEPAPEPGRRARTANVGNPHLVVLCDEVSTLDIGSIGRRLEAGYPGGINVELIAVVPERGGAAGRPGNALDLVVWERGAGITRACGTGSLAAAAVARDWGLVGDTVRVHNPGGTLDVRLGATGTEPATLGGPVRKVADVVVDLTSIS